MCLGLLIRLLDTSPSPFLIAMESGRFLFLSGSSCQSLQCVSIGQAPFLKGSINEIHYRQRLL